MSSADERAKAPFLNDYKLKFFLKRFPQTLTGGLRLNIGAPFYAYFYQILVFLWPAILGGIFTNLTEFDILEDNVGCYMFGGLIGLTVTGIHFLRLYLWSEGTETSMHNVLADDDQIVLSSCWDRETFFFIFPSNKYRLLHAAVVTALCGTTFLYLLPSRLQELGYDTGSSTILLIFNWLTLCIASHSLMVQPAPETAIFRSLDNMGINAFMRPFYVMCIVIVGVVARHHSNLDEVSQILYVIMATLPLLWTVGILPPIDALFPWLGEQILVFAFGGTYMASDIRLLLSLLVSSVTLIPACFMTNYVALVTYSAAIGFFLSLDIFHITHVVINNLKNHPRDGHLCTVTTKLKYGIPFVIGIVITSIMSHFHRDATETMFDSFGYAFLVLLVVLMGMVKNPLYQKRTPSLRSLQHERGYIGHIYNILISYVCPMIIVAFFGLFIDNARDIGSFLKALGTMRAFRWAWQNTFKCLVEVTTCCIITWFQAETWWSDLGIGVQLMLIGIITDRLYELLKKTQFMLTVYITSWTEKKQRHPVTVPTLMTSLVFFPLVFATLAISVVLSAPLTPLFCFPIFFVGFPRPKRMWPNLTAQSSSGSEGSVFYKQLVPKICSELENTITNGMLVTKSDFLLVRYQNRLIVVQIIERGYKYITLIARGLELQETSCHTIEAARVDDIFEDVLTKEKNIGFTSYPLHTLTPQSCLLVETYSDAHNVLTGVIDQPENIEKQSTNFMKCLLWVLLNNQKCTAEEDQEVSKEDPVVKNPGIENPETVETTEIIEWKDDIQTTQMTFCDLQIEEHVNSLPETKGKSSKPIKILSDADWSDKEWSNDSDSSNNAGEADTNLITGDPPILFGLPAEDIGSKMVLNAGPSQKAGGIFPRRKITPKPLENNMELTPCVTGNEQPSRWNNLILPCKKYLTQIESQFPREWFSYVSSNVHRNGGVEYDELSLMYCDVVKSCYAVINICGLHGSAFDAGPAHINKVFQDRIPWSPELDILEQDDQLKQLVLKAYRYAFKLTYDEAVLGPVESNEELLETLRDFEENWFIGIENKPGWNEAVLLEKPNLFTMGYDDELGNYTSHLLTKQKLMLYAGTLNREAVIGQWSSLAFELLYLTNDDEERYSIQAHPVLLRNLTMQAADPPLGYAVYSSGPLHITQS